MFPPRLLPILFSLSYFLCFYSISTFAGNENCLSFGNNKSATVNAEPQKLLKLGFGGGVYTVVNVVIIVMVVLNIIVYKVRQVQDANSYTPLSGKLFCCFSVADILLATNNFDDSLVLGQGGFGKVYRGVINNVPVAIKRLSSTSLQGSNEFLTEIQSLTSFRHCHLISLIGYCNALGDKDEMILVYEYMVNGTLDDHCRFGRIGRNDNLSWVQLLKICIGAARGLNYLHTGVSADRVVIHRDLKSSNILLDENWLAKISDFGLSKVAPRNTRVSTRTEKKFSYVEPGGVSTKEVMGTFGYLDPYYILTGKLTEKADVYSFGVVLFEVLCGRPAMDQGLDEKQRGLAQWAKHCMKEGTIYQIIDPNLRGKILLNCFSTFVQIANQCLHNAPKKRPTMAEVVVQLQLALAMQERGGSSILEDVVSIAGGTYDRKEPADSFRTWEVINVDNAKHRDGEIDGFVNMSDANSRQSSIKPEKRIKVTQKARVFFSVTARAISGIFQLGPSSQVLTSNLKRFKLAELKIATRNFSPDMKLGKGYFQRVFTGWLNEKTYSPSKIGVGMAIAVKRFNVNSPQRYEAWKSEVQLFGKFNHPNLVKLLGYCWEDKEVLIVYEYMQKGSLDKHLFKEGANPLSWDTRLKISIGAARGLSFLHKTENGVIHRKVKTSNILLDGDFNSKLSDFGLAKSGSLEEHTGLTASIAGAYGFLAPEYIATGCWYRKSDVYSFGAVLLEILTGQRVKDEFWHNEEEDDDDLVEWARVFLPNKTELKRLIDPRLENDYPLEGAFQFASLVLKCLETFPSDRPSIEQVLETLEQINGINVKHKEKTEAWLPDMNPEASGTSTLWTE